MLLSGAAARKGGAKGDGRKGGAKGLMGWLFDFFALRGETGLINENEGDI